MKSFKVFAVLALLALAGCNDIVPTGHVGMVKKTSGFVGSVLAPGHHQCYGRDRLYLVEVSDKNYKVPLTVLCRDKVNFKFDVQVLAAVNRLEVDKIKDAFKNVTPDSNRTLSADQLFRMYCEPLVEQEAKKIVSNYETMEIADKRAEVLNLVRAAVTKSLSGSIIKVKRVTVNNLDFPDAIEKAQEDKLKRQVEIEGIKAEAEKCLVEERNKLEIAQIEYKRRLVEAAMIADFNKIVGSSLTPSFLAWWQLKVFGEAAKGPNNWGFIPYTDHSSPANTASLQKAEKLVIDQELLKRIERAKRENTGGKK